MRVLAVGAHPDDIELGVAGTIAKHIKQLDQVCFLVLTCGEQGGGCAEVRRKEAANSAKMLGVDKIFFGEIPDTTVSESIETISKIENIIKHFKPDRVYTHALGDRHQDHRNTAKATFSAARRVRDILSYESPLACTSFNALAFSDITDLIKIKINTIKCFYSQSAKEALKAEAVEGLARFRGFQAGTKYAEAFEVGRIVL